MIGIRTVEVDSGMICSDVLRGRSEVISLTRRTGVVRIDATNDSRLVGAAQGTVTISVPKADR